MTGFMVVNVGVLRLSTPEKIPEYLHISHDIKCKLIEILHIISYLSQLRFQKIQEWITKRGSCQKNFGALWVKRCFWSAGLPTWTEGTNDAPTAVDAKKLASYSMTTPWRARTTDLGRSCSTVLREAAVQSSRNKKIQKSTRIELQEGVFAGYQLTFGVGQ